MKPYEAPEIQRELDIIKSAVLFVAPDTEAIYLFGSYAYGTPHDHSDLDVYVVVPESETRHQLDLAGEMYVTLDSIENRAKYPLDLIVQRSDVFRRHFGLPSVAGTVHRRGERLYG
jgi:predicted nucleotidyltransferase